MYKKNYKGGNSHSCECTVSYWKFNIYRMYIPISKPFLDYLKKKVNIHKHSTYMHNPQK